MVLSQRMGVGSNGVVLSRLRATLMFWSPLQMDKVRLLCGGPSGRLKVCGLGPCLRT